MSSMRTRAAPQPSAEKHGASVARKPVSAATANHDAAPPEHRPLADGFSPAPMPAHGSGACDAPPTSSRVSFRFEDIPLLPPGGCTHCPPSLPVQARLSVSRVDDPHERQADAMADWVLLPKGAPPPLARSVSAPAISRRCSKCEEEAAIQRKARQGADTLAAGPDTSDAGAALARQLTDARGAGQPLPRPFRSDMERAFGEDFGRVRVHTDGRATHLNQALQAKAFTHGSDIYFERGLPDLDSGAGRHLMAHELSHVVQQSGSARATTGGLIQRTTHTSSTPTNCHNWRIPLPPWIAGSIAHGQIAAQLRIPPQSIPRATKLLMGIPHPPAITPHGFADLWRVDGVARIAEIKSTQTGDAVAHNEARHYAQRHDEWLTRAPHTDVADLNYFTGPMGARLLAGGLLDLSSTTGTDMNLGPFWGDPLKELHIEADALGAIVYWCTGSGLPASPAWYPLFRRLVNELKDLLRQGRRALESVLEGIIEGGRAVARWVQDLVGSIVDWGLEHSRVLAFSALILLMLLAIVALIVSLLGEAHREARPRWA
ncbi:DUF4157 domain-containing protein [Corallococcus sp. AB050B]|nr:DUF4157 domain-containing protein [Corallococcus sp. AB050B]